MTKVKELYSQLFFFFYQLKSYDREGTTPEYFPIIIVSLIKSFNSLAIFIIISGVFNIDFLYKNSPDAFLVFLVIFTSFSFYTNAIKRKFIKANQIIRRQSIFKKTILISYTLFSIILPIALIYFFNEFILN